MEKRVLGPAGGGWLVFSLLTPALLLAGGLLLGDSPAMAASRPDPSGDCTPPCADIVRLSATTDRLEHRLVLEFDQPIATPGSDASGAIFGFVELDLDRDRQTGELSFVDFLTPFESGLGTDAYIPLASYRESDRSALLMDESRQVALGRVPVELAGRELALRVPRALVSSLGPVHAAAVVGSENRVGDVAPDGGFVVSTGSAAADAVHLNGERFAVEIDWRKPDGETGVGSLVTRSDDSALFWFFEASNWEFLVKVIDGCPVNQRFWVLASASTNVEYTLRVTDTRSGHFQEYRNEQGNSAAAITDTATFAVCP
ncbi:MAG: hypothetical protein AAF604_19490 [Acidobacteriota bacterium]